MWSFLAALAIFGYASPTWSHGGSTFLVWASHADHGLYQSLLATLMVAIVLLSLLRDRLTGTVTLGLAHTLVRWTGWDPTARTLHRCGIAVHALASLQCVYLAVALQTWTMVLASVLLVAWTMTAWAMDHLPFCSPRSILLMTSLIDLLQPERVKVTCSERDAESLT